MSWENASNECKNKWYARLVKIESPEENDFIRRELLAERPTAYWIGLFKFGAGFWKWSDGTQLNGYENWRDGKPNAQNLNCGQIRKGTFESGNYYDGHWRDGKCQNEKRYICKKAVSYPSTTIYKD